MLKRSFDFVASLVGILLISPIFVLLMGLVRIKMGSPVFFTQQRPGKDEEPFLFYKFRTMTNERDKSGHLLPDEERLTPFGQWLRKTSLDELPSLYNVLKGEMSLVGPRPLLMEYLSRYNDFQRQRHQVRPGITGWAQVHGRNKLSWEEKFELDVWYVKNHSFLLDIRILLVTILLVFKQEGISADGNATMPEFKKNQ